jgi:lipopolysaccharide transport system ATP-binding protein
MKSVNASLSSSLAIQSTSLTKQFYRKQSQTSGSYFNALDNLSITVSKGSKVGIIGLNGSGKSTLLKIVAGILQPSSGSISINGKVNALLEVGTGFDPELSGRQNIYLNASIIGLTKGEINSVFEDIVDFSGIRQSLDCPVKFLSSGMYSRLAFSVATHMPGDILLIDEVLSVGDALFRNKALSRMSSIMEDPSKTIILVSHSIDTITRFCEECIWLENGSLQMAGLTKQVVPKYLRKVSGLSSEDEPHQVKSNHYLREHSDPSVESPCYSFKSISILDHNHNLCDSFWWDQLIQIELVISVLDPKVEAVKGFHLFCEKRAGLKSRTHVFANFTKEFLPTINGDYKYTVVIPPRLLTSGFYTMDFVIATLIAKPIIRHDTISNILSFSILDNNEVFALNLDRFHGCIAPDLRWS